MGTFNTAQKGPTIIIPDNHKASVTPFADLLLNKQQIHRMAVAFQRALAHSFREDEQRYGKGFVERIKTQSEMKQRAEILARWFRRLRGDLGYSISHCETELSRALRAELDQTAYSPPAAGKMYGAAEGENDVRQKVN